MIVVYSRNGSSGFVMTEKSKSRPTFSGLQKPGAAPCGTKTPVKRFFGTAAVLPSGVCAGSIASRNGIASTTPAPRRNVRRGMYFLVMNALMQPPRNLRRPAGLIRRLHVHLKRLAPDDPGDER